MNKVDIKTFEPIYDTNEASKYDGFIAPDGGFYKVSVKNMHIPTHNQWADNYVVSKLNYIKLLANPSASLLYILSNLKDKQDILIHFYGYVYFGHDAYDRKPKIIYPDERINNVSVTKRQLAVIYDILDKNNELGYMNFSIEDETRENNLNAYVEKYISDLLGRRK